MNERGLTLLALVSTLLVSILMLSSIALAAPVSQTNGEPTIDASDTPVDTNVTRSEALEIARRVLGSVTLEIPRLHTEEDDQVMWIINYQTSDGEQNEIVINTTTGAYRLVLGGDESSDAYENTAIIDTDVDNRTTTLSTATTVLPLPMSTTTTTSLENRIIELLERIIALLRTQTSQ